MAYSATELITNAYYLSGVVGIEEQTVSGFQLQQGLRMLNAMLAIKTVDSRRIPYFAKYNFTAVISEEPYDIPGLITCETITYELESVRYPLEYLSREQYFGSGRANNVDSLPSIYHLERQKGGARLFFYPKPAGEYIFELYGKFSFESVTGDEDLSLAFDDYYLEYLCFVLAKRICAQFKISFSPDCAKILAEYEQEIFDVSAMDLSLRKKTSFSQQVGINYGYVNISGNWGPSP